MNQFYMPTKVICEEGAVKKFGSAFMTYGKKALIITGRTSAIKSGALADIKIELDNNQIEYEIFSEIMENPTMEIVVKAAEQYKLSNIDFIIAIGGGSPLDAAKMIGVLLKNTAVDPMDIFTNGSLTSLSILTIPTTSGTGSETTPYAIITHHGLKTKVTPMPRVFPKVSLIDVNYYMTMPVRVTKATAVDALCHLIEGYMVKNSNVYSDGLAIEGIRHFALAKEELLSGEFSKDMHLHLAHASTLGGMVISHTGTGIPHGMGYHLTYHHGVSHGKATGLFLSGMLDLYLKYCPEKKDKIDRIFEVLGIKDKKGLHQLVVELVGGFELGDELKKTYSLAMSKNTRKLASHEFSISLEEIETLYVNGLKG